MNFGDSLLRSQSLLQQHFVRHFQTKIASLFVEGSGGGVGKAQCGVSAHQDPGVVRPV